MHRPTAPRRQIVIAVSLLVIAAACSSGPAQWTFAPTPEPTPCPSISASGSAAASPSGSAAVAQTACPSAGASASASASASATASATASPSGSGGTAGCAPNDKVIDIEETGTLKMNPATVTASAGETVCFRVTNTAGFAHNFYVGPTSDIDTRNQSAAVKGVPDFTTGTQTLEYTFSGSGPFEFACWVPGHLEAGMKGAVTLQ